MGVPHRRIALALDVSTESEARTFAKELAPHVGLLKIGLELFTAVGPSVLSVGREHGLDVFLDLKLHDIPETVERAVGAAGEHGARYLTVHAAGGRAMLRRAVERASKAPKPLTLLAVTVLTSFSDDDVRSIGVDRSASDHVLFLARMAWNEGVRAFVCSPAEVKALRAAFPDSTLVVPGVRPAGADVGDQRRVATPFSAISDGADFIVVGRPIRDASDRVAAARAIAADVRRALETRAA